MKTPHAPQHAQPRPVESPSLWHTTNSAARALNISTDAIRAHIAHGYLIAYRLPSTKNNGQPGRGDIRIHADDLDAFIRSFRITPEKPQATPKKQGVAA